MNRSSRLFADGQTMSLVHVKCLPRYTLVTDGEPADTLRQYPVSAIACDIWR